MLARSNYINTLRIKIIANIVFGMYVGTIDFTVLLLLEIGEIIKLKMILKLESAKRERRSKILLNPWKGFKMVLKAKIVHSTLEMMEEMEINYIMLKSSTK